MTSNDARYFVGPDDGTVLANPIGGRVVTKLADEDTAGAYSLHENILPPQSAGPRPHLHHTHQETFYVLEGELTVRVGTRTITAPVGSCVVIPAGVVHQPSNPTPQPTRVLILFSPGGMDTFFQDAAAGRIPLQGASTDPAVLTRLANFCTKYCFEFAELPSEA